jgi:hypothetical protein
MTQKLMHQNKNYACFSKNKGHNAICEFHVL